MARMIDPEVAIEQFRLKASENVRQAVLKTLIQIRQIIVRLTKRNLVKRSGALLSAVEGASTQVEQESSGSVTGKITVGGWQVDARGNPVSRYLPVLFGSPGKTTTISPAQKMYLAVPIKNGPAYAGNVPIYTPAMLQGDIYRKGQALFTIAGNQAIFALVRSVRVRARVNPKEATEQMRETFVKNIREALLKAKGNYGMGMT